MQFRGDGLHRAHTYCALLLSAAAVPSAGHAQTPQPSQSDDPAQIIITALRRPEPLARAAAPVSVLTRRDVIESGTPKMLEFGVADETAWKVGLSCGGTIRVYVEKVG